MNTNATCIDGEFEIVIDPVYTPQPSDTFTVLTYSSRSGTFATLTGTTLAGGLALQETYGPSGLSFQVVPQ